MDDDPWKAYGDIILGLTEKLTKKLSGEEGSLVLTLSSKKDNSNFYIYGNILKIGMLNDNHITQISHGDRQFPPRAGNLVLPMDRHVSLNRRIEDRWKLEENPIVIPILDINNYTEKIHPEGFPLDLFVLNNEGFFVCVGEEVENYFRGTHSVDTSYVQALELLGLESKIPEDFREARERELNRAVGYA